MSAGVFFKTCDKASENVFEATNKHKKKIRKYYHT